MSLDQTTWKQILTCAMNRIISAQDELTDIDSRFGDADHGVTMTKLAKCAIGVIEEDTSSTIQELMNNIASALLMVNGGSAGPLWSTLVSGLAKYAPGSATLTGEDIKAMFAGSLETLREITTADIGDKTMMDTLIPAVQAIQAASNNPAEIFTAASKAADEGAANSANFVSKFGRAKSYGEQTIGTPDAGAVSMKYFFTGLYEGATQNK